MATVQFEPRILGFLCNWCSYAGADLAGVSRFQYPPTIRVIRVMCSGRVDPAFVLRGFLRGADGVMVLGCHPGDCHYATGNYYARNRMKALGWLLDLAGINPERLVLDWVSAGEGERFASLVRQFTEVITSLGPLGEYEGLEEADLRQRLTAALDVMQDEQVRWLVGRKREMLDGGDIYGGEVDPEAYEALLESKLASEFLRRRLLLMASDRPLSVREMAGELNTPSKLILPHVAALEQSGLMTMVGIEGRSPRYQRA